MDTSGTVGCEFMFQESILQKGVGPHLELVQDQSNPWNRRSKLHTMSLVTKIE